MRSNSCICYPAQRSNDDDEEEEEEEVAPARHFASCSCSLFGFSSVAEIDLRRTERGRALEECERCNVVVGTER